MWPRIMELNLGLWLLMSPFLFRHGSEETILWATDFIAGALIITFALMSYWHRTQKIHLLNVAVACWLIGFGRLYIFHEPPPALQNYILIGLLDLMFAIIPSYSSQPPLSWAEFSPAEKARTKTT